MTPRNVSRGASLALTDLQGVEEGDLRGVHAGGAGGHDHVDGGRHAGAGCGLQSVGLDVVLQLEDGHVGEDQADLVLQLGAQSLQLLDRATELLVVLEVFHVVLEFSGAQLEHLPDDSLVRVRGRGAQHLRSWQSGARCCAW